MSVVIPSHITALQEPSCGRVSSVKSQLMKVTEIIMMVSHRCLKLDSKAAWGRIVLFSVQPQTHEVYCKSFFCERSSRFFFSLCSEERKNATDSFSPDGGVYGSEGNKSPVCVRVCVRSHLYCVCLYTIRGRSSGCLSKNKSSASSGYNANPHIVAASQESLSPDPVSSFVVW